MTVGLLDLPEELIHDHIIGDLRSDDIVQLRQVCKKLDAAGLRFPFVIHDPEKDDYKLQFDEDDWANGLKQAVMECLFFIAHQPKLYVDYIPPHWDWPPVQDCDCDTREWGALVSLHTCEGKSFQLKRNISGEVDIYGDDYIHGIFVRENADLPFVQSIGYELLYRRLRFSGLSIDRVSFVFDGNALMCLPTPDLQIVFGRMLKLLEWLPADYSGMLYWRTKRQGMLDMEYHLEKVKHGKVASYFNADNGNVYRSIPLGLTGIGAGVRFISLTLKVHKYDNMYTCNCGRGVHRGGPEGY